MKLDRKGVAIRAALGMYLKPKLAQDAAPKDLTEILNTYKTPQTIAQAISAKYKPVLAADMELAPEELVEVIEASAGTVEPESTPSVAGDDDNEAILAALREAGVSEDKIAVVAAALSPAADEEVDERPEEMPGFNKPETVSKPAMDEAIRLAADSATKRAAANFRAIREAESEVRPLIGDVVAMDSADDVYRTALEQTGVDLTGVHPSAFRSMVKYAIEQKQAVKTPRVALDAAAASTFAADFPTAGKLKRSY